MGGLALTRSKTTGSIPASRRTLRTPSRRPAFTIPWSVARRGRVIPRARASWPSVLSAPIPWTRRVGVSYVRTGETSTIARLLDRDLPVDRAQVDPLAPSVDLRHDVDDQREGVHGAHEVERLLVVDGVQVVLEPLPDVEPQEQGRDHARHRDERDPGHGVSGDRRVLIQLLLAPGKDRRGDRRSEERHRDDEGSVQDVRRELA